MCHRQIKSLRCVIFSRALELEKKSLFARQIRLYNLNVDNIFCLFFFLARYQNNNLDSH